MPNRFDFGSVNLSGGENSAGARPSSETPFRILILGDFSGRSSRGIVEPGTIDRRRPIPIDRDDFDDVLAGFGVKLHLTVQDEAALVLSFSQLEDFHPDHLFESLDIFRKLRDLRARLQDPTTFQDAARQLSPSHASSSEARKPPTTGVTPSPVSLAGGNLLDEMIEQTESRRPSENAGRPLDDIHAFARQIAERYAEPTPDPRQPEFLALIDRATTGLMRALLHNPDFQALESLWRGVFDLVRRVETGPQLKICLLDISKEELTDLRSAVDIKDAGLYRLLVDQTVKTPGAEPWALLVGSYVFGPDEDDVNALRRIAEIAKQAGAPFVAGASSHILGCSSFASSPHPRDWDSSSSERKRWIELRSYSEAAWIALALPRLLLRMPYGKKTSQLESFDFEEMPARPEHETYLWGNPSLALASMLAQSFSQEGWAMRPGEISEMGGLPLHMHELDGTPSVKPCAEALLTEDAVGRMLEEGLIPIVSFKNRDVIRVPRFQSISLPARALTGRWAS